MKHILATVVLVTAISCMAGCGTVCNLAVGTINPDPDHEPKIYGGVLNDLYFMQAAFDGPGTNGHASGGGKEAVVIVALLALEPALSFTGDTLTLPITIYLTNQRAAAYERENILPDRRQSTDTEPNHHSDEEPANPDEPHWAQPLPR